MSYPLTQSIARVFRKVRWVKCLVHHIEKFFGLIILDLCINVHSCFAIFMSGKILDCLWEPEKDGTSPVNPPEIEDRINSITGVVETGFFTKNKPSIFIARSDGTVEER